ncbi:hypothetical protein ACFZC3_09075 [Streptomyces sp. NPDC007903]|uniref:hypothetical protein n=1 Tax=Streptomyces sp. NPDC007903 TaxID=3364786 RepID=UPI0036E9E347
MERQRLGWTMEQRAGVKRYFTMGTVLVALGVALSIFLIASGNAGGWALLAIMVVPWILTYVYLRSLGKNQP